MGIVGLDMSEILCELQENKSFHITGAKRMSVFYTTYFQMELFERDYRAFEHSLSEISWLDFIHIAINDLNDQLSKDDLICLKKL